MPTPVAAAAGPSTARRASISQPPIIRRTSDGTDRPKREIHPPPSKDLSYAEIPGTRKPKRRNDPQLQWVARTLKAIEMSQKTYALIEPFLYPIESIVNSIPDYSRVIKKPIDVLHIRAKIEDGVYESLAQADADIQLMIKNALTYNPPQDPVHFSAQQFQQLWAEKLRSAPAKQEPREESEDPLIAGSVEGYSEDEEGKLVRFRSEIYLPSQVCDV